ncbi:MAG: heavy metal translocating P-type ATPase metal-binding domain-containing protein [Balneolaceae bacterium]
MQTAEILIHKETTCYHCGEACLEEIVKLDEKTFCCTGCKLVYEILSENELNTYYCLEDQPGISLKKNRYRGGFDFLNDPAVVELLADFMQGETVHVSLSIPNIHCTSCVWLLENLYKLDSGIKNSRVNFLKRELSISYNRKETSLRSIAELLSSIGYEPELRLEKLDHKSGLFPNRRLWLKLGVAGFAFGNIMLFSFPEYLSDSTLDSQGAYHIFFGILNIALALPVLFYSSSDYLKSAWAAIKQGGINLDVPISIGILALFLRSVYEIVSGTGAGYMDSFTGLIFFLLIGRIVQNKTYERLSFDRDYKSYLPISITVVDSGGSTKTVSIDKLKEGDRMLVRNQELIPADSLLLSEKAFVDYSFITGESDPVEIQKGDRIYAGGKIMGTSAEMSIIKEVSGSYITKLWNDAAFDPAQKKNITTLADRISPHFTLAVIGIAVTSGFLWLPYGSDMAISVFTAVLIIACPCALALSSPFTLGSALNIFSRNGLYIKSTDVVENLAKAGSVVFDKTGTLTQADSAEVTFCGNLLSASDASLIKSVCRQSTHPLSQKIADHLDSCPKVPVRLFNEMLNNGIKSEAAGRQVVIGSPDFVKGFLKNGTIKKVKDKRSVSRVDVAVDGEWLGWFEINGKYRSGIRELLNNLKTRFSIFLISGDNDTQKEHLATFFDEDSLRFQQTPQEKLEFIKNLQKQKDGRVVMIGDGLNDAGALQQSDFGIALTENISSFTPACDAILDSSSLNRLDTFINFARKSINIIKYSFGLSLAYNVIGLSFAVAGKLTPLVAAIIMPVSSISIMIFTTTATWLTAKRMGMNQWK